MPILDGLSTARRLRQMDRQVNIVFISIAAKYAIDGYEVDAADYFTKPIDFAALKERLFKLLKVCDEQRRADIFVAVEDGFARLNLQNILYVEKEQHDVVFHLADSEYHTRMNLKQVEEMFFRHNFIKCNRGCLVNFDAIEKVSRNSVYVRGKVLLISHGMKKSFRENFRNYARIVQGGVCNPGNGIDPS